MSQANNELAAAAAAVRTGQLSRRAFLRRALATGVGLTSASTILAACGGAENTGDATAAATGASTAAPAQPESSTLTYATSGFPPGIDSDSQIALPSIETQWNVYDYPMRWSRTRDEEGNWVEDWNTETWQNWLLEDFEASADGTEWTLVMKDGVVSHSGNPLIADDFKYMWDRHFELGILGPFWATVGRVEGPDSYEVVDDKTFRIRTSTPSPGMLTMLENLLAMHPWDSVEALKHATDDDPWATEWIARNGDKAGHGPYVVDEWNAGDEVVLRAFEDYHAGKPPVDRISYKFVESSATRLALLKQGAVDLARDLLPTEFEEAARTDGLEVTSWRGARSRILVMIPNLATKEEFADVRVRQALAHAAPYPEIVDDVYRGFASRWNGAIPQDFPYFTDEFWQYGDGNNVQEARRLLEQAGYGDGFEVTLLYNSSLPVLEQNAILIQSALGEIGITVQLDKLADAAFTQRYTGGEFELLLLDDLTLTPDIGYSTFLWFQTSSPQNVGSYSNDEVDRLSEQILSTLDEDVRRDTGIEIQRLIVEECPQIFLCQPHYTVAKRQGVAGETALSARVQRLDYLTLE